ncbi:MAG: hypothetical protein ACI3U2_02365 [Anaerovibrio sp.]
MNKYAMYIRQVLSERDLAEQLAEECSELAKASLKMIRAGGMSANITPTSRMDAMANFYEEQKDVVSVLWLLTMDERYAYIDDYPKFERWARRLGYKEGEKKKGALRMIKRKPEYQGVYYSPNVDNGKYL